MGCLNQLGETSMRCLSLTIVLAVTLTFTASAAARDIYVSNTTGDDRYDGLSETFLGGRTGPVRTINKALRIVDKGDRIVLAKTDIPYYESLSLSAANHCGLESSPLVIFGNNAILDGTVEISPRAWEVVSENVYRFRPERLNYQQLYHGPRPAVQRHVDESSGKLPELEPLEWMLHEGYIYFCVEPERLPEDYPLRYAGLQTGITLYHVRNVVIRDLVVQGFQLDGVNAHDGVNRTSLVGLTCRGNGRSGISIGGSSRTVVNSCLVGDNGVAQVRVEGYTIADLVNTQIVDNTAPAIDHQGGRLFINGQPAVPPQQP